MTEGALQLSAWILSPDPRALDSLRKNASRLSRAYPIWYRLGDEGLAARNSAFSAAERAALAASGVELWAESDCQDEARVFRMVSDSHCADFHAKGLVKLALEDGTKGLVLNYGQLRASALLDFQAFVARLKLECEAAGLKLGLVGAPEGLKLHLDACLTCPLESPSGPLAGIPWISEQLSTAIAAAGATSAVLGFPGLGFGFEGQRLDFAAWDALVAKHGPARRDALSGELVLKQDGQSAWFSDSIAALGKLLLARDAGLSQAAVLSLGYEDPRLWGMLDDFPVPFAREKHGL